MRDAARSARPDSSRFDLPPVGGLMRPNSARKVDMATDGAVRVLAREGLTGLSLRTVGAELRVTPQVVRQWFGGVGPMRTHVADELGRRWVAWLTTVYRGTSLRVQTVEEASWPWNGMLPMDAEEVASTRAWLALSQGARDDDEIAEVVVPWERRKSQIVERLCAHHGPRLTPDQRSLVLATVRGLRHAVCSRVDPMTPHVARQRLRAVLDTLARHNEVMPEAMPDRRAVAAIDCGTNSIKLLIGSVRADGGIDVLLRESRVVRLGQGVDTTGELHPDALERTFAALDELAALVREHEVPTERIAFCATSATRDARNSDVFTEGVRRRIGVVPRVLSGDDEATLVYAGTMAGRSAVGSVLAVDIGGGSTELVLGEAGTPTPRASTSMDIGSVRLHERHLTSDPPTAEQVAACVADIEEHLDAAPVHVAAAGTVIGTSGTVKTIACAVLGLSSYDREAYDGAELAIDDVRATCDRLVAMGVEERRALPYVHPGRADVIGAGALIWSGILARAGTPTVLVSEADLLHGIAATIGR